MKDIVDRYNSARVEPAPKDMLDEAIAEIKKLRARIAELEALLKDPREEIAKAFESLPDIKWSSRDAAYVVRHMTRQRCAEWREGMTDNLAARLRAELEEMAKMASVNMELWDRFSNRVLAAADALEAQAKEIKKLKSDFRLHAGDCASLSNELDLMQEQRNIADVENTELRARIAELEAALKPFAECAMKNSWPGEKIRLVFSMKTLLSARAALNGERG